MDSVKIIKVGNSLAVTVPRELALRLNLREGDKMIPKVQKKGISYNTSKTDSAESKEMDQFLEEFMKEYGPAMKKLAKH